MMPAAVPCRPSPWRLVDRRTNGDVKRKAVTCFDVKKGPGRQDYILTGTDMTIWGSKVEIVQILRMDPA